MAAAEQEAAVSPDGDQEAAVSAAGGQEAAVSPAGGQEAGALCALRLVADYSSDSGQE